MTIAEPYQSKLVTQAYRDTSVIEGVEIIPLVLHADDGGNFLEMFRVEGQHVQGLATPFEAKQVSMSLMLPGVVKAYHLHDHQDDLWFVPPQHRLLVNMHDVRQDSNSFDVHMRFVLGGGKAQLVRIPAGVAHGVKNCYDQAMMLIYATSAHFNPENPDELRLPWNQFGEECWELQKG